MSLVQEMNEKLALVIREEIDEELEGIDEAQRGAIRHLTRRGWHPVKGSKGQETTVYENPDFPGHQIVNWKNAIHHLKDNEHVSTIAHWSAKAPVDELPKYMNKTFKKGR
jgi:hypothetical protein